MERYIQKLHSEHKEQTLLKTMQEAFPDFEVSYQFATEHAAYFIFKSNGVVVVEFIVSNFKCHPFNIDEWLYKLKFDKKVNRIYLNFMANEFKDFVENYKLSQGAKFEENLLI